MLQGVTRSYRGLQGVTRGHRELQGVTGGYKGLQGGYRGLQGVTGDYKGLQGVTGGYRGFWLEIIKPGSKPFIVATWYRPLNSPFELFSTFEDFVGKLDADGKEYYLMGDFNCSMLPASFYNANTQALLNITDIYNLKQLITEPTRITPLSSTLIDVIFTNLPDNTTCSGVSHIGISDHSLIYVYRKISSPSVIKGTSTITYRQFKNFNRNSFRSDILAQPWDDLKGVHNPNEMWLKWKTSAPLRSKRVRGSKRPWITTELKEMMHF